jgi:hypothetical protein
VKPRKSILFILSIVVLICGCSSICGGNYNLYVDFELRYDYIADTTHTRITATVVHSAGQTLTTTNETNIDDARIKYNGNLLYYHSAAYGSYGKYKTNSEFSFSEGEEFEIELKINNNEKFFNYDVTIDVRPEVNPLDEILSSDNEIIISFNGESTGFSKKLFARFYNDEEVLSEIESSTSADSDEIILVLPTVEFANQVELILECKGAVEDSDSEMNIHKAFNYQYFGTFQYLPY